MLARLEAILAAVLFGASTPFAKVLLGSVAPLMLAGLLYVGAGLVGALALAMRREPRGRSLDAREKLALGGAVLAGGLIAPVLMMLGLAGTPAGTSSLLLNFEAVATALMAGFVFREAIGARIWIAIVLVTSASSLLAFRSGETWGLSWGALAVLGACAFWGLDNNLTRVVSGWSPMAIVAVKGWGAGTFALALAFASGHALPPGRIVVMTLVLGGVSFGLSIALFVRALRGIGAARTAALFGTAPFLGALISWTLLGESPTATAWVAVPLMLAGAWLLVAEPHTHRHHHAELYHEHMHTHDDGYHDHHHEGEDVPPGTRHSHPHRHGPMAPSGGS